MGIGVGKLQSNGLKDKISIKFLLFLIKNKRVKRLKIVKLKRKIGKLFPKKNKRVFWICS